MKTCDLNSGAGQLALAFSQLKERWAETKSQWTDITMQQFEKKYLSEIPTRVQMLMSAAQRLAEVVEKAERELEESHD